MPRGLCWCIFSDQLAVRADFGMQSAKDRAAASYTDVDPEEAMFLERCAPPAQHALILLQLRRSWAAGAAKPSRYASCTRP